MATKTLGLIHTSATLVPIFADLCKAKIPSVNVFNIGNKPLVSVNEILSFILKEKKIADIKIKYTGEPAWPGDVATYTFDDSKIRR